MAKYKSPEMSWTLQDLHQEWRHFCREASCIFDGPPRDEEDSVKVSYLKLWVGDKGLDVFEGFTFAKPEDALKLRVILQKFEDYCAPRKNHIMAALKFNERRQGERDFWILCDRSKNSRQRLWLSRRRLYGSWCDRFRCKYTKVREKCLNLADELALEEGLKLVETTKRIQTAWKNHQRMKTQVWMP